jgi:8-oxo-dGTP pyrophosphatase MutT (NUDIX family)
MIPDEARAAEVPDASNTQAPRYRDVPQQWPVVSSVEDARGPVVTLRSDTVRMPDGNVAVRQVVVHPGAVAIAALDESARILMIRQYRHPVGRLLWELPAGLRDVPGEPLLATAERELLEETGYRAQDWLVLADFFTSPGITTERTRMFLARGLTLVPESEREYIPRDEEAHLLVAWVPLEQAVARFLAGDLHNGVTGVGILSAYAARQIGFTALRRPDAPEH